MSKNKLFGPSTLVAAAFIGPGTITICTLAGSQSGYTLLWALLFSVIATIVLQEMAARLGLITQAGLGEAIQKYQSNAIAKIALVFIVFAAIIIGNAAYEAGNISGAILGLDLISGDFNGWAIVIGGIAGILLYVGKYKWIERLLVGLVLIMSACFFLTAILVKPDITSLLNGVVPSTFKDKELLLVLGLIGTTVVPYNLFLHASSVKEKWTEPSDLKWLRIENYVAIGIGGFVSACILITAGTTLHQLKIEVNNAADMAIQLEPLFGTSAKYAIAIGLFAAGISSAITAPLAAAYAANGLFGWKTNIQDNRFRLVWGIVLLIGVVFSSLGFKPILIIQFAQIANGILLPIIAGYLLYLMNQSAILGKYTNNTLQNIIGGIVVLITVVIGLKGINAVFHFFS